LVFLLAESSGDAAGNSDAEAKGHTKGDVVEHDAEGGAEGDPQGDTNRDVLDILASLLLVQIAHLRRFLKPLLGDFVLVDPFRDSLGSFPRALPCPASLVFGPLVNRSVTPRLPGFRSVVMEWFRA